MPLITKRSYRKYARKEKRKKISILAFTIKNKTADTLKFSEDIRCYNAGKEITPLSTEVIHARIKQGVGHYLLYGMIFFTYYSGGVYYPVPVGMPVALYNFTVAIRGNTKFRKEFTRLNLAEKVFQPNDSIFGLLAFRDLDGGEVELEVVKD
ncbi:MAG: hypothetical protein K8R53_07330 [Bacteroidales bacterium]|nr:hypothetical protein [Bacteroidales bacterium]